MIHGSTLLLPLSYLYKFLLFFQTMPQIYKRTSGRGSDPALLQRGAKVVEKLNSVRAAARSFGVYRMTLKRYMDKQKNDRFCIGFFIEPYTKRVYKES